MNRAPKGVVLENATYLDSEVYTSAGLLPSTRRMIGSLGTRRDAVSAGDRIVGEEAPCRDRRSHVPVACGKQEQRGRVQKPTVANTPRPTMVTSNATMRCGGNGNGIGR
jgi:hypothetical protein